MTVMELLRGARPDTRASPDLDDHPPLRMLLAGAGAAAASALLMVLPALVVWVASSQSTVPWTDALGLGAALWLLGQGAHLTVGAVTVTLTPLLLAALSLTIAVVGATRATAGAVGGALRWRLLPNRGLLAVGAWSTGYAVVAAAWAGLALTSPAPPALLSLALPVLGTPLVAALVAGARLAGAGTSARATATAAATASAGARGAGAQSDPAPHRSLRLPSLVPDIVTRALRRAWRPALVGSATMLGTGLLLCVVMLVVHRGQVGGLQRELDAGLVGGAALVVGQLALLPNVALWAVSFLAGTGFHVVEGASTTWTGSRTGLMPMVPALGGLPAPGAFPGWLPLVVLLPVGVGALIGWRSLQSLARLSGLRSKLTVTAIAVLLAAGSLGLLDLLGGGAAGVGRLSDIGAPAGWLTLALALEFALGAAAVLGWDQWRLRRGRR